MERVLAEVDVDSVSVAYGRGPDAVADVSLRVEPGSIVALLGPSGCGNRGQSTQASSNSTASP